MLGHEKPQHPLITLLDASEVGITEEMIGRRMTSELYYIALKGGHCGMMYGRNHYDFEEGVLIFTAPHQVVGFTEEMLDYEPEGWMLFFHPDLIRRSSLGKHIDEYSFFSYDVHEALHLSDEEKQMVTGLAEMLQKEYTQRIDGHSQRVIVSTLELLLNHSSRFYERQFHTRTNHHSDTVSLFEQELKSYFASGKLLEEGVPSVQYFAERVHLSANYLSDLLKKETGRGAKDHINDFLVEKAKDLLLTTDDSISQIAYSLGFNYPHYFSRLFKSRTGMTPQGYRTLN